MIRPSGSMCQACSKFKQDCSRLTFESMPVIKRTGDDVKVKCVEFVREKK